MAVCTLDTFFLLPCELCQFQVKKLQFILQIPCISSKRGLIPAAMIEITPTRKFYKVKVTKKTVLTACSLFMCASITFIIRFK